MFKIVAIGCVMIVITVCLHATAMGVLLRFLKLSRLSIVANESAVTKAATVSAVAAGMFISSLLGSFLWACAYHIFGVFTDLETASYFSLVTYTTLGYGDVVMEGKWRLLSAVQAANGIIIFGWTTAVTVAAVQRLYFDPIVNNDATATKDPSDV